MLVFGGLDTFVDVPIDDQNITVSNTVLILTVPGTAEGAVLEVITQPVRFTVSGRVPAATVGFSIAAGTRFALLGRDTMHAFQVIREGGVDATLYVNYFEARREGA